MQVALLAAIGKKRSVKRRRTSASGQAAADGCWALAARPGIRYSHVAEQNDVRDRRAWTASGITAASFAEDTAASPAGKGYPV